MELLKDIPGATARLRQLAQRLHEVFKVIRRNAEQVAKPLLAMASDRRMRRRARLLNEGSVSLNLVGEPAGSTGFQEIVQRESIRHRKMMRGLDAERKQVRMHSIKVRKLFDDRALTGCWCPSGSHSRVSHDC